MTASEYEDIEAIKILRSRYFRSMDTADFTTFSSLLAEDLKTDLRGSDYHFHFDNRNDFVAAVASAMHAGLVAQHVAHLPEIALTGPDTAEGIWYLQDWALDLTTQKFRAGTAIIRDKYRKLHGAWKISHYEYTRVTELSWPMPQGTEITAHYLRDHGRKIS
jgi:hypothetical protein